jgi:hypothetical protein
MRMTQKGFDPCLFDHYLILLDSYFFFLAPLLGCFRNIPIAFKKILTAAQVDLHLPLFISRSINIESIN